MTQEEAVLIFRKVSLTTLAAEHPTTRRVIEAIPAERGDFRPDAVAKSAFELAWHIVGAEHMFLNGLASGAFDYSIARPPSIRTAADIAEWFGTDFAATLERLQQLPGEALLKTLDFRGVRQMPALRFAQLAVNHTIHHRGQLSMYLRPMGAKVPSIYGESYDARQAREAAAKQ